MEEDESLLLNAAEGNAESGVLGLAGTAKGG
jgi:hypothetical protein